MPRIGLTRVGVSVQNMQVQRVSPTRRDVRMRAIMIGAAWFCGALTACQNPAAPTSDVLTASAGPLPGILQLHNRTREPVFYAVHERDALATADYLLCIDPSCASVPAHGVVSLPYSRISGFRRGVTEAVVYHWLLRPRAGAFAPDSVRVLIVPLE